MNERLSAFATMRCGYRYRGAPLRNLERGITLCACSNTWRHALDTTLVLCTVKLTHWWSTLTFLTASRASCVLRPQTLAEPCLDTEASV